MSVRLVFITVVTCAQILKAAIDVVVQPDFFCQVMKEHVKPPIHAPSTMVAAVKYAISTITTSSVLAVMVLSLTCMIRHSAAISTNANEKTSKFANNKTAYLISNRQKLILISFISQLKMSTAVC